MLLEIKLNDYLCNFANYLIAVPNKTQCLQRNILQKFLK